MGLFLAMSLMSLNLASLAGAALPLVAVLVVRSASRGSCCRTSCSACWAASRDAAVATSGHFGPAPGATPTAVAIMTATTKAHGASPRSFLVAPLVGALFVDIADAAVPQGFMLRPGRRVTRGAYAPRNTRAPQRRFPS